MAGKQTIRTWLDISIANCNNDKVWIATWRLYSYWYYNPT